MPFLENNFGKTHNQSQGALDHYVYTTTTDDLATVSAAGYFAVNRYSKDPKNEDYASSIIEVYASDGHGFFKINSDKTTVTQIHTAVLDQTPTTPEMQFDYTRPGASDIAVGTPIYFDTGYANNNVIVDVTNPTTFKRPLAIVKEALTASSGKLMIRGFLITACHGTGLAVGQRIFWSQSVLQDSQSTNTHWTNDSASSTDNVVYGYIHTNATVPTIAFDFATRIATASAGSGHALESLAAGTWAVQVSAARITDDGPNPDPSVTSASPLTQVEWDDIDGGSGGIQASLTAWNGGALDVANDRIYVSSSGHSDGQFNSTQFFDFSDDQNESWNSLTYPSYPIASDNSGINPDNTPDARHNYGSLAIADGHMYMSGQSVNEAALGDPLLWRQNLTTGAWAHLTATELDNVLRNEYATCIAYDSVTGLVWCWSNRGLFTVDPANFAEAGLVQRLDNLFGDHWGFTSDTSKSMVIDESKRKILVMGQFNSPESVVIDISNLGSITTVEPTWTGDGAAAFIAESRAGLAYDSSTQDVVGWTGGADVYAIDLDAHTITIVNPDAGNTVTPPDMITNGVFNRFTYHPTYDAFVLVNGNDQAYYYKRA